MKELSQILLEIAERSRALNHRDYCPATLKALYGPCNCGAESLKQRILKLDIREAEAEKEEQC